MRSADHQQREFSMLIGAFESFTRPPDESPEFADLLTRFDDIGEAGHLARENDISLEEACDLLDCFQ